jgi:hypothetical protein
MAFGDTDLTDLFGEGGPIGQGWVCCLSQNKCMPPASCPDWARMAIYSTEAECIARNTDCGGMGEPEGPTSLDPDDGAQRPGLPGLGPRDPYPGESLDDLALCWVCEPTPGWSTLPEGHPLRANSCRMHWCWPHDFANPAVHPSQSECENYCFASIVPFYPPYFSNPHQQIGYECIYHGDTGVNQCVVKEGSYQFETLGECYGYCFSPQNPLWRSDVAPGPLPGEGAWMSPPRQPTTPY